MTNSSPTFLKLYEESEVKRKLTELISTMNDSGPSYETAMAIDRYNKCCNWALRAWCAGFYVNPDIVNKNFHVFKLWQAGVFSNTRLAEMANLATHSTQSSKKEG